MIWNDRIVSLFIFVCYQFSAAFDEPNKLHLLHVVVKAHPVSGKYAPSSFNSHSVR